MKIVRGASKEFDLAILGLGYESRSVYSYQSNENIIDKAIALGYSAQTDQLSYPDNKAFFDKHRVPVVEGEDREIFSYIEKVICELSRPINVLLDISVLSRHRLATIMLMFIEGLLEGSQLTITYSTSEYNPPPEGTTPIKEVGEIASRLAGSLGDLSKPLSLVLGLGYEKNKALGISNYLDGDSDLTYVFIPESRVRDFELDVRENNETLIESILPRNVFKYNVSDPVNTYLDIKLLVQTLSEFSRPLLIPLGPKILSAMCVLVAEEFSYEVPVWRVSSEHTELPVDRAATGEEITFTVSL